MKIEELFEDWSQDSVLDKTELGDESLKIPKLHSKYYQRLVQERLILKKLEADMKQLKLGKWEFYTQGPSDESREKGWEMPAKGMILKQEVQWYMDADKDIIDVSLKIGIQQEKIEMLTSIVQTLNNRGYQIKNAIDWLKFINGGS